MADVQAAKRYASAAFDIAVEQGAVDRWRGELADVASVLAESDLARMLGDGRIPIADRLAIVDRVLDVDPMVLNLAKLLITKSRASEATAVSRAFNRMADERAGIAHATLTTAVPLSDEQRIAIETRLSTSLGKTVRAVAQVDPSIIGGVVIKVGDKLVDGSVRTRLRLLKRELEGAY